MDKPHNPTPGTASQPCETQLNLSNDDAKVNDIKENEDILGISEAGRFALAAICATSMGELFPEPWERSFCLQTIKFVLTNLQLPERQVEPQMLEMINGNFPNSNESFVALLTSEACFANVGNMENVINQFIIMSVFDGKYDARWRVLILHMTKIFNVEDIVVDKFEQNLVSCLLEKTAQLSEEEQKKAANRKLSAKAKRYAWIGLATIGGGALLGITGGLAAPMIGAGLSFIPGIAGVVTALTGSGVIFGSLFGAAGGGLTGYKMHKRVGDIEEFEFHELNPIVPDELDAESAQVSMSTPKELHITIVISGWIKNKSEENFTKPWINLLNGREQYYLKYDSSYLLELGKAMEYILTCVASVATQQVLKFTVLSSLLSAIMWPSWLLGLSSVIDNPWGVCLRRSAQAGKQLAEVLLARSHGHRPVTLVGYSLGARVIYYCLREMSGRKNCEGVIQDVILIGAPCTAQTKEWKEFTRVVAGRIVNGYCRGDWLLKFLYRTLSVAVDGVAGLQPIEFESHKMHNVDLTDMVTGHSDYPEQMSEILSHVGIRVAHSDKTVCVVESDDGLKPTDSDETHD